MLTFEPSKLFLYMVPDGELDFVFWTSIFRDDSRPGLSHKPLCEVHYKSKMWYKILYEDLIWSWPVLFVREGCVDHISMVWIMINNWYFHISNTKQFREIYHIHTNKTFAWVLCLIQWDCIFIMWQERNDQSYVIFVLLYIYI